MSTITTAIEELLLDNADKEYISYSKNLTYKHWLDLDYEDEETIHVKSGVYSYKFKVLEGIEPNTGDLVTAAVYNYKKIG